MNIPSLPNPKPKNPLGIIALFIAFLYSAFGLFFSFSKDLQLDVYQKWVIITFLTMFPLIILAVFFRLVTKHHTKLYAPGEYRNEENFMRVTPRQVPEDDTIDVEIEDTLREAQPLSAPSVEYVTNAESFRLVEDLAILRLQAEMRVPAQREAEIHNQNERARVDALFDTQSIVHLVEIKYVRGSSVSRHAIESLQRIVRILNSNYQIFRDMFGKELRFTAILVYEGIERESFENVRSNILNQLGENALPVSVRGIPLADLFGSFGLRHGA